MGQPAGEEQHGQDGPVAFALERVRRRRFQERARLGVAFAAGLLANLLVIVEFVCLLAAFDLPTTPITVVAALFATGAAHMFPVPAGVGVLEGAQMWMFEMLGYPADVGLAVGLAVRLREVIWMLPGVVFLLGGGVRSNQFLDDANILDVMPTLLYAAGCPIGRDLDGRVLVSAFGNDFLAPAPLTFVPSYETLAPEGADSP